jgi:hypothetical protein
MMPAKTLPSLAMCKISVNYGQKPELVTDR